ncbi:lysylphosphatidylglycerol synthase domain-containing protein [Oceanihabitans sediminis]|uniref:lysylphosphatidylglycerol synthase domain-containing protein n=1 Tax=Oceanihabitans sediminis TaxID=1812012 RepID=UPI00299EE362|nr:lysylphosphatidylglycerol synthase domain-containing protein [Oceanihabitans sediminis]MDX1278413.1 lysylphosphatidylglycerol synthase domain-containing protein [Oceanihabitans sediminis]
MYKALPYKTKHFFFVLIKLSIVFGAFYFIYNKLTSNKEIDFNEFIHFLNEKRVFSLKNIFFLLLLSGMNWVLEIFKWQILVQAIKKISFNEALKQSLGALTASLFTPNRIGDYGAKALYFTSKYRKQILLLNFIGNTAQMLITVLLGSIGLYYFTTEHPIEINYLKTIRLLAVALLLVLLFLFGINQNRFKIKGFSIDKIICFIQKLSFPIKASTFLLSLLRYFVFSFQFYFLLGIFGIEISYLDAMIAITSMYLLASIIPSIFIFDVLIKGSVAVYIFTQIGVDTFTILSIILLMWILNFVLPSILGSFYVLTFKLPKTKNA